MTQKVLIISWLVRAKTVETAHFEFSLLFQRRHYVWGGLLITSSAFTSALTAVVEKENGFEQFASELWVFVPRVILAIFVPICAATVTF